MTTAKRLRRITLNNNSATRKEQIKIILMSDLEYSNDLYKYHRRPQLNS
jgi:hypothetical protein